MKIKTSEMLKAVDDTGIVLSIKNDTLNVSCSQSTDKKIINFIKRHKVKLTAAVKIRQLFNGVIVSELLDWYEDDMHAVSLMSDEQLTAMVEDYLKRRVEQNYIEVNP